jgi:hypothetical protein
MLIYFTKSGKIHEFLNEDALQKTGESKRPPLSRFITQRIRILEAVAQQVALAFTFFLAAFLVAFFLTATRFAIRFTSL